MTSQLPPAGWYADPNGGPGQMYWDGQRWHAEIPVPPPGPQMAPAILTTPQPRRRTALIAGLAVAIVILVAVAGIVGYNLWRKSTRPTAPPVAESALEGLLLSPEQINSATGATGMKFVAKVTTMPDISSWVSDKACVAVAGQAESTVYAGSKWSAMREQVYGDQTTGQLVNEAVVLFPSAKDASAFYTASTQSWPACSNRQFNISVGGSGNAAVVNVGTVSTTNGILSVTLTETANGGHLTGQRALAVANNVVIDIQAAGSGLDVVLNPAGAIAGQIAAKVPH